MAQIKKKFLASNAVDGTKVQYSNNESFRAKSQSGVDVELFKLDNSNIFQFLQMPRVGSDPSSGNDVSRKSYVDAQVLAEAAARVQADAAETAAREAAIASEASARQAADTQLASDLAAETAARVAAVGAEQAAREAADTSLTNDLADEISDRQAAVSAEQSRAEAAEAGLQSAIDAEETRALAAEAGLQSAIDALDTGNAQALSDEIAARIAADEGLQDQVDAEKARIDAILLASDADKDSFAEIVSLINSVDTENDSAFASYVLSNNAALAQEVSDREAAVSAEQSAREAADSAEQSARQAADSAESAARVAGDEALASDLADEVAARQAADSSEAAAREAADSAEASARQAADAVLTADLAQEVSDRQAAVSAEASARQTADGELQDAIDAEVSARQSAVSGEEAARMAADSGIQSELDATQGGAGLGVDGSYTAPVGSQHLGSAVSLKDADSKLDAAIVAETNARTTAVSNLEQSISDLDAAMTQGFDDAQSYTDQKISDLVAGAPALLDTLNELAAAIGDDENFAGNIMTAVANEAAARQAADTAEAQARSAADDALQASLNNAISDRIAADAAEQAAREAADAAESAARTAELPRHAKVRKTLSSTDISNGYVDLDHVALASACHVFIDRLACHESDDYTVSTISGKTRVTFSAGFMSSEEGPGEGDLFRCGYMYKNSDQSSGSGGGDTGGDTGGGGGGGGGSVSNPTLSMMFISETSAYISFDVAAQSGDYIRAWANSLPVSNPVSLSADELGKSIPFNPGLQLANGTTVSFFYYRADNSLVGETVATWTFNTGDTGGDTGGGGGGDAGPEMLAVVTMSTSSAFITWASGSGWQSGDYISASKPGGPLLADYTYVGPGETAANVGFDPSTLSVGDYVLFNYHRADGGVVNYTAGQWNG